MDLFTFNLNSQLPRFMSRNQVPGSEGVDALQTPWPRGIALCILSTSDSGLISQESSGNPDGTFLA